MSHFDPMHLLTSLPWFAWIAIVAIICGCIKGLAAMRYRHLERIEMIRQGMNPDALTDNAKPACERDF